MTSWRSYTEVERASAVGLSMTIGTKRASAQLGIPRRTLSSWLQRQTPEVAAAIGRTQDDVAARLWEAVTAGTDAVLAGLRDPKARLGEKATALRIVVEAHALITGGPTARVESTVSTEREMTGDEKDALRRFLEGVEQASDDEIREWAADGGLAALRESELEVKRLRAGGEASDVR